MADSVAQRRNGLVVAQVGRMSSSYLGRLLIAVVPVVLSVGLVSGPGVAATPAPAAASDDAVRGYTRAQALFHERKFAEAVAALDVYCAAHPRDARALVLRGDAKADLGQNEAALRDYNVAIGIAPEYQYAYVTRCETRLQLDDTAGALADCNQALRLDATDALAFEDRADVEFQRETYPAALTDYDKAIELGRNSAYVFAARCDTERLVGKRDRARADCEKALTIDPKSRRGL
jgi:tetratricopeptide (TPR) repeat protein